MRRMTQCKDIPQLVFKRAADASPGWWYDFHDRMMKGEYNGHHDTEKFKKENPAWVMKDATVKQKDDSRVVYSHDQKRILGTPIIQIERRR